MKYTLLQMTQDILSNLSSDEINSISDTPESLQVATIIKQKYFDIVNRLDLPNHDQLIQLLPSGDATKPALMYIPNGIDSIKWIKYFDSNNLDGNTATDFAHDLNTDITTTLPAWSTTSTTSNPITTGSLTFTVASGLSINTGDTATCLAINNNNMSGTVTSYSGTTLVLNITSTNGSGTYTSWTITQGSSIATGPGYLYVTVLPNEEFINMVSSFNLNDEGVQSYTLSDTNNGFNGNFTIYYKNNSQPSYCTIISNYYVLFDSFDSTQESTLQSSKTMCLGEIIPEFLVEDAFIPNLSEDQFQLLLNEAKATAYFELKQQMHPLAQQEVQRGWSTIQKKKAVINRPTFFDELPGFGRKRGYYGYKGSYYTGINDNQRGGLY